MFLRLLFSLLTFLCFNGIATVVLGFVYRHAHWYVRQSIVQTLYVGSASLFLSWSILSLSGQAPMWFIICVCAVWLLVSWLGLRIVRLYRHLRDATTLSEDLLGHASLPTEEVIACSAVVTQAPIHGQLQLRLVAGRQRLHLLRYVVPRNTYIHRTTIQAGDRVQLYVKLHADPVNKHRYTARWAYVHHVDLPELRTLALYGTSYIAWTLTWICFLLLPALYLVGGGL